MNLSSPSRAVEACIQTRREETSRLVRSQALARRPLYLEFHLQVRQDRRFLLPSTLLCRVRLAVRPFLSLRSIKGEGIDRESIDSLDRE